MNYGFNLTGCILGAALMIGAAGVPAAARTSGEAPAAVAGSVSLAAPLAVDAKGVVGRQASQEVVNSALPGMKGKGHVTKRAPKRSTGLSVYGPKGRRGVEAHVDHESAAMFESFEGCVHGGIQMPLGWTSESKGTDAVKDEDHWIGLSKDYTDYYMFAAPADGNMLVALFYNDEANKDEWLISPAVTIPSEDYSLNFYWYTVPYYLYVIDRFHVDFENGVFTDRELYFNVEVLAREDGGEWTVIYDLEKQFADIEYAELAMIDFDEMQLAEVSLARYAGKSIQIAFRYFGKEGNTFCLDAVSVDLPRPTVSYAPHFSRLYYGFSPDEDMWWMPASIEFYPVNHPLYWENTSPVTKGVDFTWTYTGLDGDGNLVQQTSTNTDCLEVTYRPDYTNAQTLMNNFYPLPKLSGRGPKGGIGTCIGTSDFMQAGGTTEFEFAPQQGGYKQYRALQFDILTEGLSFYMLGDDALGFFMEPIFGRSVNTDDWWRHYCFPESYTEEGRYAYTDGFANMYLPHDSAPLVVRGVSAMAMGTIYPEAEFTAKIYTMTADGYIVEKPIATKTIKGSDVVQVSSGLTQKYLMLDFKLDEPVIFDTAGTGYGYFVEISGYHDEKIEYFAPLQSMVPNANEWALSFYHLYSTFDVMYDRNLTDQMGYVAMFRGEDGRDLYTSFAIGLDAHYPWLERADDAAVEISDESKSFGLHGYYSADAYTVEAPEWVAVSLDGRYNTTVTVEPLEVFNEDRTGTILISAPGVELSVDFTLKAGTSGIGSIAGDAATARGPIFNLQGMLVKANATAAQVDDLPAGIYFFQGKKLVVKGK